MKPSHGVKVTGTYQTGTGTWKYESLVVVHLKDGTNYEYTEKGQFKNVAYNDCMTTWETVEDPNIENSPGLRILDNGGPAPTSAPILK